MLTSPGKKERERERERRRETVNLRSAAMKAKSVASTPKRSFSSKLLAYPYLHIRNKEFSWGDSFAQALLVPVEGPHSPLLFMHSRYAVKCIYD
ncbi:hypothetical protein FCM35_KLT01370 [Carex littledalei]|uniref:Uncharacterized protein n=1 Tax=Carex littledalei TaxID=544730 RepID=A0A833RDM3_9POAL|nr:hypothetical protein FCM35_KLT01370 [Carex littledalei]